MGVASQDYRDGEATGAAKLAVRAHKLHTWGVEITPTVLVALADAIAAEMGGTVEGEAQ